MPIDKLVHALRAVDWNSNVVTFTKDHAKLETIANANYRIAIWSRQFERIDKGNAALCFVRAMQVAGHYVAALVALPLYQSAAGSMRAMLESALYYSYYRTHPAELATVVRDPGFFVTKLDLLEYHKQHTESFAELQGKFGLVQRINKWYSGVSAITHGQIPGQWITHKSLAEISHSDSVAAAVVGTFAEGEQLVHEFLLCSAGRELWGGFSKEAKGILSRGLSGELKAALGIDTA